MSGQDYSVPFAVGDVVYKGYSPQSLGKVLAVRPTSGRTASNGRYDQEALVVWKRTGVQEWIPAWHYQSLAQLIADHERKLRGHKQRLKDMQRWTP